MVKDEEGLVDRLTREVMLCLRTGKFRKEGEDFNGGRCNYCTYFYPGLQFEPVDCGYRGDQINILVGNKSDWNHHYISFYKCYNVEQRKERRRK